MPVGIISLSGLGGDTTSNLTTALYGEYFGIGQGSDRYRTEPWRMVLQRSVGTTTSESIFTHFSPKYSGIGLAEF